MDDLKAIISEGAYDSAEVVSVPHSKYDYAAIVEALKAGKMWVCSPTITKNKVARILSETQKLMPNVTVAKGTLKKKSATDPTQFVIFIAPN